MFKATGVFSGFSVNKLAEAKEFYSETLGLDVRKDGSGLRIFHPNGGTTFIYPKPSHKPAEYTMLNLVVDDIDASVAELKQRGVVFEVYNSKWQDDSGVMRGLSHDMGPDIAWFKDPAGNIVSILQDK